MNYITNCRKYDMKFAKTKLFLRRANKKAKNGAEESPCRFVVIFSDLRSNLI